MAKNDFTVPFCTVIEPASIRELDTPDFGIGGQYTEEEYLSYLTMMQPVFEEYMRSGSIDSYVLQLPKEEQFSFRVNFYANFTGAGDSVRVRRHKDGTYSLLGNGWHRLFIARKHDLKLLVYVKETD